MTDASVAVCSWGSEATSKGAEETLTLGRRLADGLGATLTWLLLGKVGSDPLTLAAAYGVDVVRTVSAMPADFQPDVYVAALESYCSKYSPAAVVFSQTYEARLAAPRLAARLETGVVMNTIDVVAMGGQIQATASAFGGDTRAVYVFGEARPCILAVSPGTVEPYPNPTDAGAPAVEPIDLALDGVSERTSVLQRAQASGPRLEDARVVVAGGRGLLQSGNFRLVERLAELLGGLPGASRAIVDDGWVGPEVQVGLTGRVTKPELYVAVGISGASQHMAGCSASKVIVGINKDPEAAIYRYARYGVVGDAKDVLAELIALLEDAQ
jgi:electron transfer flavoprotein alpha subunit